MGTSGFLKALVVDDEALAREEMIDLLADHPHVTVEWEAATLGEARRILSDHRPDVVFLDIQLRGGNGFELISDIHETTDIVFVTAFDEYAVRAFEINAVDYLMKPVNPDRLKLSLDRLGRMKTATRSGRSPVGPFSASDKIFVKTESNHLCLNCQDIAAITSLGGNYTIVRLTNGDEHAVRKTFKDWEEMLPGDLFTRINRAAMINREEIISVSKAEDRRFKVYLRGIETAFYVSRRAAQSFKAILAE